MKRKNNEVKKDRCIVYYVSLVGNKFSTPKLTQENKFERNFYARIVWKNVRCRPDTDRGGGNFSNKKIFSRGGLELTGIYSLSIFYLECISGPSHRSHENFINFKYAFKSLLAGYDCFDHFNCFTSTRPSQKI